MIGKIEVRVTSIDDIGIASGIGPALKKSITGDIKNMANMPITSDELARAIEMILRSEERSGRALRERLVTELIRQGIDLSELLSQAARMERYVLMGEMPELEP